MARADHYATLGVKKDASPEEIKRAYRRLALDCHPDRFPGDAEAEERFRRVSEAYAVLGDADKRRAYDRSRLLPERVDLDNPPNFPTPREIFNNVFGDVFGNRREERRRGRDLRYTLTVDLEEAVLGSVHEIRFEANGPCSICRGSGGQPGGRAAEPCPSCEGRGEMKAGGLFSRRSVCGRCNGMGMIQPDPCDECRGTGRRRESRSFTVRLPPGTDAGAERVLRGQGEPGRYGGESGDLKVTVNLRPHRWLRREDADIHMDLPVSYAELVQGAKVEVPTVEGWVTLELPAGIDPGKRLRLRGKGVPGPRGTRGDQMVTIQLELPRRLNERMRGAVDALAKAANEHPELHPRREALARAARDSNRSSRGASAGASSASGRGDEGGSS